MSREGEASRRELLGLVGAGIAGLAGCVTDDQVREEASESAAQSRLAVDPDLPPADRAQAAWEAVTRVREDTESAAATRLEAYVRIEEAVREAAVVVPLYHGLAERCWRDRVSIPDGVVPGTSWYRHVETTTPTGELTVQTDPIFSLDPVRWNGPPSGPLAAVYETLTAVETPGAPPTDRLLADTDREDDGLIRHLTVRSGVTFHDGRPLTAADVVYSWRRAIEADPVLARPWPRGLGLSAERTADGELVPESLAESLRAVDKKTVELRLAEPAPELRRAIAESSFVVLPEGLVGDATGYDGEIEQETLAESGSVGTGPFAFETVDLDTEIRLERADTYHGQRPSVAQLRWLFREGEPAWTAILEDRTDLFTIPEVAYEHSALSVETSDRGRRSGTYGPVDLLGESVSYRAEPTRTTVSLGANAANVPPVVRRAIADVLGRERLLALLGQRRVPAGTVTPPGLWPAGDEDGSGIFNDPYQRALAADPYGRGESRTEAARDRLTAVGIDPDSRVTYTLTITESESRRLLAEWLGATLAELGVDLVIEEVSRLSLRERGETGDIELWLAGLRWGDTAVGTELSRLVPTRTDTALIPETTDGLYLDWQTELDR